MIEELIVSNPKISIVIIAGLVSLFISVVNYFVMDKERVSESKKRQKELQKEMKEHRNNPSKMNEIQQEMMSHMRQNFKHTIKPMAITMLPILVVFYWIKNVFTVALAGWFWWYLVSAIAFSLIFRKLFKLP